MKELTLDSILIPMGIGVLGTSHIWLLYTINRNPTRTVIGINAKSRHKWGFNMMEDPLKNGVLAIQTIRNNIMASTFLLTAAITALSSLIGVYVSSSSSPASTSLQLVYGNKTQSCL